MLFGDHYPPITREGVYGVRAGEGAHRICFATTHSHQPKRSSGRYFGKFEIPFFESVGPVFEDALQVSLFRSQFGGFWRSIQDENEFSSIQRWVAGQGTRVFMRDCLTSSIALDFNLTDSKDTHTEMGDCEARCKIQHDGQALGRIVEAMAATIRELPGYRSAPMIAAVPPRLGKTYDLPSLLSATLAKELGKIDITGSLAFNATKKQIKEIPLEDKWGAWDQAGLACSAPYQGRPDVILIDDKYQSGISAQYVGSKLREFGLGGIYGLYIVKTLRDTDNT